MAINTLITIKDALQAFVDGHGQLKRIEWEADDHRAPSITSGDTFPMLFVAPIDVAVGRAMNVHTLRIYVYERINDDRDDVIENANDTSLLLRDIRVWWNNYGEDDIEIVEDFTGNFVSDRELDNVVGYYADIKFSIPSHGRCDVPINVVPSPIPTCADGTLNILNSSDGLIKSVEVASGAVEDTYINDTAIFARNSNADIVATAVSLGGAVSSDVDIPDTTYDIYLDGVFKETVTLPTLANEDLNIILV